ncbi:MAG TPA: GNAT family N-acyltransferase [Rhodocyclaceae bacterium]
MLHERAEADVGLSHPQYHVGMARTPSEIREAQKLRHRVFAGEMGAHLQEKEPGVDADFFDPFCEHLIVRDETNGRIVGTYRILTPEAARRVGSYYTETEFDLTRIAHLKPRLVEVGRSCIDPDYRNGTVIALLWMKLAEFMVKNGYEYLVGCASISMADGGHNAANLYVQLIDKYMSPVEYRGFPRSRLPYERLVTGQAAEIPPLVKGYLRAGAWICGDPAWDPDFNSADLLILLPMSRINPRYVKHFVKA